MYDLLLDLLRRGQYDTPTACQDTGDLACEEVVWVMIGGTTDAYI